jgi:acyl-CoA synthetase (AMP-forming)/AMP-acid ligase II
MDLGKKLAKNAREFPEKPAIIYKDTYTSYAKLNQRAARFANAMLSLGLKPREKMAIILKNRTEYLEIVHGLVKAGLTIVPVNWRFSSEEMRYVLSNSEASAVILSEEFMEKLNPIMKDLPHVPANRYIHLDGAPPAHMHAYEELLTAASTKEPSIENSPKAPFYIGYTSGTTGFPKGAVNPHGDWAVKEMALSAIFGMRHDDVQLLTMPLFHANALSSSCVGHYTGQTIVIMERFDAEQMLRLVEKYRTTFSSMVPTMFNRLKNLPPEVFHKYDVSSMRGMIQSSAPLPFSTKQWIIENFKNCGLHEFYGGTEVGVVTYLSPEEQLKKPGSVGKAIPTIEVKLVDDTGNEVPKGQVGQVISRPLQGAPIARAAGYYKDAKSTSKWSRTVGFTAAIWPIWMMTAITIWSTAKSI